MVVYSTKIKQSDHDGNSMRVKYHGLGVVADKDTDGEEQIERKKPKPKKPIEPDQPPPDMPQTILPRRTWYR